MVVAAAMTKVFHDIPQLQVPSLQHPKLIRQWGSRRRAQACCPRPSDCGGCLLSAPSDRPHPPPRPQQHTLGWSTRGLPHFIKKDDNPFARKIRDLPVSSWFRWSLAAEAGHKFPGFHHVLSSFIKTISPVHLKL